MLWFVRPFLHGGFGMWAEGDFIVCSACVILHPWGRES